MEYRKQHQWLLGRLLWKNKAMCGWPESSTARMGIGEFSYVDMNSSIEPLLKSKLIGLTSHPVPSWGKILLRSELWSLLGLIMSKTCD